MINVLAILATVGVVMLVGIVTMIKIEGDMDND